MKSLAVKIPFGRVQSSEIIQELASVHVEHKCCTQSLLNDLYSSYVNHSSGLSTVELVELQLMDEICSWMAT